jgi:hypothetical protein
MRRLAVLTLTASALLAGLNTAAAHAEPVPGVGAVRSEHGVIELVRTAQDGTVQAETWTGAAGSASGFASLGGTGTSDPDIASWDDGNVHVVVRGLDNAIWYDSRQSGDWSGWVSLGGAFASAPTIVSWGANRLDVFAEGLDGAVWSNYWDGLTWSGWYSLGGTVTSHPVASSLDVDHWEVFARGSDGAVWERRWNGTAFEPWSSVGGAIVGAPGAIANYDGRINLLATGPDGQLWANGWDEWNDAWGGWQPSDSFGEYIASSPELANPGGFFYVFGVYSDGRLFANLRYPFGGKYGDWAEVN